MRRRGAAGSTGRFRLLVAAGVGAVAAAVAAALVSADMVPLVGWDVAAGLLITWIWADIARRDAEGTAERAVEEDPTVASSDLVLLAAAVASLAAVGLVFLRTTGGNEQVGRVTLGVGSVVLSWALVHTIFTLRYAKLYYTGEDGGG
jgi:uncharacterized membrane protein